MTKSNLTLNFHESANHLGNFNGCWLCVARPYRHESRVFRASVTNLGVLVTYTDKRLAECQEDTIYRYMADVKSQTDYSAFHALLPDRQWYSNNDSGNYRFGGSNGQEKTDELSGIGNHYTAEYWEMDPRLGRRWNVDPKSCIVPNLSPYSVLRNNPLIYTAKKGDIGHLVIVDNPNGDGGTVFLVATYFVVKGSVENNGFSNAEINEIKNIESHLNSQNYQITDDVFYDGQKLSGYKVQFKLNIIEVDELPATGVQNIITFDAPVANGSRNLMPNNVIENFSSDIFAGLGGISKIAGDHNCRIEDIAAATSEDGNAIANQDGVIAYEDRGATFGSNILHEMFHTWGVNKDDADVDENSIGTASPTPNSDDINQAIRSLINSGNVSKGTGTPQKR